MVIRVLFCIAIEAGLLTGIGGVSLLAPGEPTLMLESYLSAFTLKEATAGGVRYRC